MDKTEDLYIAFRNAVMDRETIEKLNLDNVSPQQQFIRQHKKIADKFAGEKAAEEAAQTIAARIIEIINNALK